MGNEETKVFYYEGLKITDDERLELDGWTYDTNRPVYKWYVNGTNINSKNRNGIVSKTKPEYEETIKDELKRFKNELIHPVLEAAVAVARAEARLRYLKKIKDEMNKTDSDAMKLAEQEKIIEDQKRIIEDQKNIMKNKKSEKARYEYNNERYNNHNNRPRY